MIHSMTGFASQTGSAPGVTWTIEIRGVNAKGLDIRVRAPDRMTGFDQTVKARYQKSVARGNINVSVRTEHDGAAGNVRINDAALETYLAIAKEVEARAGDAKLELAPAKATDFLGLRGVMITGDDAQTLPPEDVVLKTADAAMAEFLEMRAAEGAALDEVLRAALAEVADLVGQADELAQQRAAKTRDALVQNLARVLDNSDGADADRVAQELAILSVKSDVTEEIDRLNAHVDAARALLDAGGAVGRKLDFLMQEFNREANTLCSKSGSTELTRVGLDLKALIDQMREQVQNVE